MLDTSIREHVAGVLRAEARRRRLTQRAVAARVGRSPMWVSDRFTGKIPCDVEDLAVFAEVFGLDLHDLLPGRSAS